MRFKRFGRTLFCLLLVCCLMFNIATIPARASAAAITTTVIGVSAALVVGSILIGMGVSPGSTTTDFDTVVGNCIDYLSDAGTWVIDGLCTVWSITNGNYKYAVDEGLIETVRNWFCNDSGVLDTSSAYYSCYTSRACTSFADALAYAQFCPAAYIGYDSSGNKCVIVTNVSDYAILSDGVLTIYGYGTNHSIWYNGLTNFSVRGSATVTYKYSNVVQLTTSRPVSTSADLVLSSLMSPGISIATGYADWAAPAVGIDDSTETETGTYDVLYTYGTYIEDGGTNNGTSGDEEDGDKTLKWLYPLGLAATLSEQLALTQEQVQAGESTYEYQDSDTGTDTETGVITGTFADTAVGTFINSLIDALWTPIEWIGAQIAAVPAAITDFFTFDTDISTYVVEISSFFPFCIPWDIYHFFELFQAEPEAPHFVFDVPFPYMEDDWHIEIDLSSWDTVASWLRAVELIGFIVGLALVTREKFLRG